MAEATATVSGMWRKLKTTNFTTASFDTALGKSTLTKPAASADVGVIEMLQSGVAFGALVQNALILKFFGTDADGENFNARVYGWSQERDTSSWESVLLAQFALTMGSAQGTALCAITASDFEVDTIALTHGNDDVDVSIVSNAANIRGCKARLEFEGCPLVTVHFDMNSSAASANALYRKM